MFSLGCMVKFKNQYSNLSLTLPLWMYTNARTLADFKVHPT